MTGQIQRNKSDAGFMAVLQLLKKEVMLETNCHAVGKIQSFDPTKQTCSVKINYKKTFLRRDEQSGLYKKELKDYPLLVDCPTIVNKGDNGSAGITIPIKKGDSCLVLFNDRDMDNWFSGNNNGPVNTNRLHSISDGIALVGVSSLSETLSEYDNEAVTLFYGETTIKIKDGEILMENGNVTAKITEDLMSISGGGTTVTMNSGGKVEISNSAGSLNGILGQVLDAISAITITDPQSGSAIPINNAPQFATLKTLLGQLLL